MTDLLRFDLGTSLVTGKPVIEEIGMQLGHTIELALAAIVLSLFIGPPLGILAGLRPGGVLDRTLMLVSTGLRALPQFGALWRPTHRCQYRHCVQQIQNGHERPAHGRWLESYRRGIHGF